MREDPARSIAEAATIVASDNTTPMESVAALCQLDRTMMSEFNRRTLQSLELHRSFRLVMPVFRTLMAANVEKELDKDRMVIETVTGVWGSGADVAEVDIDALFERTKAVDRRFISDLSGLPITLRLEYGRIRPIRIRRIEQLVDLVFTLCRSWQPGGGLMEAVRASHEAEDFQGVLAEVLDLYCLETRVVCESVRLRGPARLAGRLVAHRVYGAMRSVRDEVALRVGSQLYPRRELA